MLYKNELGISNEKVFEMYALLGEAVVSQYIEIPTTTMAQTSFHGTHNSILQNPSQEYAGVEREQLNVKSDLKTWEKSQRRWRQIPMCT